MGLFPSQKPCGKWEKCILVGFPGSIAVMEVDAVKRYTLRLLRSVIPGDRLAMIASTENRVSDVALNRLSAITGRATLSLAAATRRGE